MNNNISVILNTYNRIQYLHEQIAHICNQTIKPIEIFIWNNSEKPITIDPNDLPTIPITVFNCTTNMGVWPRFFAGFNCKGDYIAYFDDDTIPGLQWFENCINSMKIKKGLYGTTGYRFGYQSYFQSQRIGWLQGNDGIEEVDIVGHAWFLKKKWLQYFVNDLPKTHDVSMPNAFNADFKLCGEDVHLTYTLKKYGGIRSYIPPQPVNPNETTIQLYGSIKGVTYGTDQSALSLKEGMNSKFEAVYRYWLYYLGHIPTIYEPVLNHPHFVFPYKYQWHYIYKMIKDKSNFAFMSFGQIELHLMLKDYTDNHKDNHTDNHKDNHTDNHKDNHTDNHTDNQDYQDTQKYDQLSNDLMDITKNGKDPNIYYGFAKTDDFDRFVVYYDLFRNALYSNKQISYYNHFTNSNHILTKEFLFDDLYNKRLGDVVLFCSLDYEKYIETHEQHGLYDVHGINSQWINQVYYLPNDIINWWDDNYNKCKENAIDIAKQYNNTLFIFSVELISSILINTMYKANPNNRYIDMDMSLECIFKDLNTNNMSQISDDIIKISDDNIEFIKTI